MFRLRTLSVALILAAASSVAANAATLTENFAQSYPLQAGGTFSVNNVNGEVVVEAWDEPMVDVSAVKTVQADSKSKAQDTLEAIRIEVTAAADHIAIQTKMPHQDGLLLDWLIRHNINAKIDWHIHVPRHLKLVVENNNGRVDLSGTTGEARIETTNGAVAAAHAEGILKFTTTNGTVTLQDLSGSIKVETTNGGIHAQLNQVKGEVSLETTNGSIMLSLPSDVRASLEASTTHGSVRSDFEVVGGTSPHHHLSGAIDPREVARLVAAPGSSSGHHLSGAINGGGGKLALSTTNGSIQISQGAS